MSAESQPLSAAVTPPSASETENKTARRRAAVMAEIISTEAVYNENLSVLVSSFQKPLVMVIEQLERDDLDLAVKGMFRHIPQILGFHTHLLSELKKCETAIAIAETFKRISPFFKLYTAYINEYDHYIDSVTLLRENKKTNAVLESAREATGGRDIMSYLITPVQRIPRFELLLRELHRYCITEEEKAALDAALDSVKAVAQKINEAKRDAEQKSRLVEILSMLTDLEEHITPPFLRPSRKFVHAGYLWEIPDQFSARRKERFVILLNDLILWTECIKPNKSYRVKGALPLDTCELMLHDGVVVSTQPLFTPEGEPCTVQNWPTPTKPPADLLAPPQVVPSTIRSPLTSSLLLQWYDLSSSSPTHASQNISASTGLFSTLGVKPSKSVKFAFPDTVFPLSSSALTVLSQELARGALPSPTVNLTQSAAAAAAAAGSAVPPATAVFPSLAGSLSSLTSDEYTALQTVWLETFDRIFDDTRQARASVMIQLKPQSVPTSTQTPSAAAATTTTSQPVRKAPPRPTHARGTSSIDLEGEEIKHSVSAESKSEELAVVEIPDVSKAHQRSGSSLSATSISSASGLVPPAVSPRPFTSSMAAAAAPESAVVATAVTAPEVSTEVASATQVEREMSVSSDVTNTHAISSPPAPTVVRADDSKSHMPPPPAVRPPRPAALDPEHGAGHSPSNTLSPVPPPRSSLPPPVPTAPRLVPVSSVAAHSTHAAQVVQTLEKAVRALQGITRAEITFLKQVGRARAPPRFILAVEAVAIAVNWAQTQGKDPTTAPVTATPSAGGHRRQVSGSHIAAPSPLASTALRSRHSFTFGVDSSTTAALAATVSPTLTAIQSGRPLVALSPTAISMLVSTHLATYLQTYSHYALTLVQAAASLPLNADTSFVARNEDKLPPVDKIVASDFVRLDAILRTPALQAVAHATSRKAALALLGDSRAALVFWAFALALHAAQSECGSNALSTDEENDDSQFLAFPPDWAFEADTDASHGHGHEHEHKTVQTSEATSARTLEHAPPPASAAMGVARPGTARTSLSTRQASDVRSNVGGATGSLSRIARPKTAVGPSATSTSTTLHPRPSTTQSTNVPPSPSNRVRPSTASATSTQSHTSSHALPSQGLAAKSSIALAPRPSLDAVLRGRAVHGLNRRASTGSQPVPVTRTSTSITSTAAAAAASTTASSASTSASASVRPQALARPSTAATTAHSTSTSLASSVSRTARKSVANTATQASTTATTTRVRK